MTTTTTMMMMKVAHDVTVYEKQDGFFGLLLLTKKQIPAM
jgi:hypothetical protein